MKKIVYVLLCAALFSCGDDDDATLSGRYVEDVFADVDITFDVKYGANNALVGPTSDLYLDVYQPAGDNTPNRPLLLLAHGGAFVQGTKNQLKEMATVYAKKGYVVVSMQYRLINDLSILDKDSVAYAEGVVLTLADMRAAIRYMRNDAVNGDNTYNIDPNMIIIGGVSAGAVMSMNVGFLDRDDRNYPTYLQDLQAENGGFEGDTNDLTVSSEVQGIISYSGSVFRDSWIDSNDPPIFMVHDEFDPVVPCPYEDTNVVPFPLLAYGSCAIESKLNEAGIMNEFLLIAGSDGHVSYLGGEQGKEIIDQSAVFINKILTGAM